MMNPNVAIPTLGKLYLVPTTLGDETLDYLPPVSIRKAKELKYYFVEKQKTARRFLKTIDPEINIQEIAFSDMGRHAAINFPLLGEWLEDGHDVGVMSEAGLPCVADPGNKLVAYAHQIGARVVPLPGSNSMLLALVSSGLSGQAYCFSGYIPIKQKTRRRTIRELEQRSARKQETQIFMETPYRNNGLLESLLEVCQESTLLGIATDLTLESEFIRTLSVGEWKKNPPDLHKRPTVFTLYAYY